MSLLLFSIIHKMITYNPPLSSYMFHFTEHIILRYLHICFTSRFYQSIHTYFEELRFLILPCVSKFYFIFNKSFFNQQSDIQVLSSSVKLTFQFLFDGSSSSYQTFSYICKIYGTIL